MPRRRPLPNLHDLAAFEAAAHSLNFTHAAQDLNVQQPAISRRIGQLEAWIGVPLFDRHGSKLSLTYAGSRLFQATRGALDDIADAIREIQPNDTPPPLKAGASIAFASQWLIPRLNRFRADHPGIEVGLSTRYHNAISASDTEDVIIVFRNDETADITDCSLVFEEHIVVVCSAAYLERAGAAITLENLNDHPLLVLDEAAHRDDWRTILAPHGLRPQTVRTELIFENFVVYLNAVLNGDGIGLAWRQLVENHLESGVLRQPIDIEHRSQRGYYAYVGPNARSDNEARMLINWMCAEGAAQGA